MDLITLCGVDIVCSGLVSFAVMLAAIKLLGLTRSSRRTKVFVTSMVIAFAAETGFFLTSVITELTSNSGDRLAFVTAAAEFYAGAVLSTWIIMPILFVAALAAISAVRKVAPPVDSITGGG